MLPTTFDQRAAAHWTKEREAKVTGAKNWPIRPSAAPRLLRTMGLLAADATMPADALRKFSQVNHMLTLLVPVLEDLVARHKVVRILDVGCGNSYLSLILAWWLASKQNHAAQIVGVDSRADVIATSQTRAAAAGLATTLRFTCQPIATVAPAELFAQLFGGSGGRPHLVVALHACDTASDDALALGIRAEADAMAVAPCCQAELAQKWVTLSNTDHPLTAVFSSPHLRRETAAQITDAMRLLLARAHGYETVATEFTPSEHTTKNRLLLCRRRGRFLQKAAAEYRALTESVGGCEIRLASLLSSAATPPSPADPKNPFHSPDGTAP